jgi:NAD(P)-dependent dehydrogenase (short-subunit alcohol dehydrogenase family)
MGKLEGRVALITGGNSGIGLATAKEFVNEGGLFALIKREKGKLDIVFANAGTASFASVGQITEEHFDSIFNLNVKGLLFTVQKALPLIHRCQ